MLSHVVLGPLSDVTQRLVFINKSEVKANSERVQCKRFQVEPGLLELNSIGTEFHRSTNTFSACSKKHGLALISKTTLGS